MDCEPNPFEAPRSATPPEPDLDRGAMSCISRLMRLLWWSLIPVFAVAFAFAPRDGHPWQWPVAIYGNGYIALVAVISAVYGLFRLVFRGFRSRG